MFRKLFVAMIPLRQVVDNGPHLWLAEPVPCYVSDSARAGMRIDDQVRKCIAFVGVEANGRFIPTGTGFVAGVACDELEFVFLVTAAHVLDAMASDTFSVRLNRRDGSASTIQLNRQHAIHHAKKANDIAVVPFQPDFSVYDFLALKLDREELEKRRQEFWDVGLGDEVCAVGLYTSHHGLAKNIPVVRLGNIAALLDEPVLTPRGYTQAYLVELRTIAGLSGSPVFVVAPPMRVRNGRMQFQDSTNLGMATTQLGVLVAYHVVESAEDQVQVPMYQTDTGDYDETAEKKYSLDERNTGFGIVIPIERVLDIVEREDLKKEMKKIADDFARKKGARPASAPLPAGHAAADEEAPAAGEDHRERFKRLLDAAVKPPKSSD